MSLPHPGSATPGSTRLPNPVCRVRYWGGDPRTIGAQVAAYLRTESPQGRRLLAQWHAWRAQPGLAARARAIENVLSRVWPPVLLEMIAMAEAVGVDPRPVLAEWAAPPSHPRQLTGPSHGRSCTAFWVPAHLSATGRPLVGRNFDLRLSRPERLMTWTMTTAGWGHCGMSGRAGRTEGLNAAGLVVATTEAQLRPAAANQLGGSAAHGERIGLRAAAAGALPARLVTRIVLERCATVDEAIKLLSELAQWTHFNYLVADAAGASAVVEVGVNHTAVRTVRDGDCPFLVTTNHFVAASLQGETDFRWMTRQKYRSSLAGLAARQAAAPGGKLSPADCQAVLAGPGVVQRHITLWSQVFEPGGRRMWLAAGRPDRNPFVALPAPGALTGGSPGVYQDIAVGGHREE